MTSPLPVHAEDAEFMHWWYGLTPLEKDALAPADYGRHTARYRGLTLYVDATVERLQRDQERKAIDCEVVAAAKNATGGDASGRITYRRALDIQAKPIRWLWPRRIARGKVSIVAGNPGLGKSQVTVSMAAVVTTGGDWPVDRTRCERGNVIFLSAEDDPADTIRPRLEAAGADLSRVFILDAVVESYRADGAEVARAFNLKHDLDRLGALLTEIGDVALVVIDPVTAYLGDSDSHVNAEVRALLAPLSDLAVKHGTAVVCVTHLNKGGGSDALMRVTGSMAFVAAARSAWLVAKDPEVESRRLFLPLKNNIGNDETGLAFAVESAEVKSAAGLIETSRVLWEPHSVTMTANEAMAPQGDPEERSAVDDAKQFLSGLLADGPVPFSQVKADADGAGHSWATIRRAQKALGIESSKVGMKMGWEWALPRRCSEGAPHKNMSTLSTFGNIEHLRANSDLSPNAVEVPKATSGTEGDTQKRMAPSGGDSSVAGESASEAYRRASRG